MTRRYSCPPYGPWRPVAPDQRPSTARAGSSWPRTSASRAVVVALRRREDVDDDRPEVEQDPVRRRACPRGRYGLDLLVAQGADDPVGDRVELALRAARADDEVVGQRRQARPGRAARCRRPSCPRRARRSAAPARAASRSAGSGACPRLGRPSASRRRRASRTGGVGSVTIRGSSGRVSVERMVGDVGRDRIRDEVAERAPGGRALAQLAMPTAGRRGPSRNTTRSARPGNARDDRRRGRRSGSRRAARPRGGPARAPAPARARSASPANASADRMNTSRASRRPPAAPPAAPPACRPCTTARRGRAPSGSPRTPGCRRSRARPSPADVAATVTAGRACAAAAPAGHEQDPLQARGPRAPPRRPRGGRRGSGRTSRRRRPAAVTRRRLRPLARRRSPRPPTGSALPLELDAADADRVAGRDARPAAARRRCPAAPGRAGSARPTPRSSKLVWAAIRSIALAADPEGPVVLAARR